MKAKIDRQDLLNLIDNHFAEYLLDEKYDLSSVEPSKLITHNRLDLAIKILYLQMKEFDDVLFAKELYINHIKAFTLGSFKEPGNEEKDGIKKYLDDFDCIWKSINECGIDEKKSIIPLSSAGSIANGAHRVSSAYISNKKIPVVRLDIPNDKYDFNFFLGRGMSQGDIETAVTKFIEFSENSYIAIIWPSAGGKQKNLNNILPNIIYQNTVSLNHNGAHNLLSQVYYEESWLGNRDDNFPGVKNKLVECFKAYEDLRVIAFQAESIEKVLAFKEEIRQLYGIGKHSVHISDTREEAVRIARVLFNKNSIHFLNYGNPNRYQSTHKRIKEFKNFLEKNNLNVNRTIIDSSIVLSLYGLRECNDIDYLSIDKELSFSDSGIENHARELVFHCENQNTLILDDKYCFYYEDLKFISFAQLQRMKGNRAEEKDVNDLSLMAALLDNNFYKGFVASFKQNYYFGKVKLKLKAMNLLRVVGLYEFIRAIYRVIKRK